MSAKNNSQLAPTRVDCTPENIEQGLAKLVLSLIELLRQLLERQAIRRMEGGSLTDEKIEEMGTALMKLEQKIAELAQNFGLTMADLNLDLGPIGNLLEKSPSLVTGGKKVPGGER
ncbi:MAG TPA: gas vesicle protein K [Terriglobales bacterium]|nr:gas vesicle protein K [Terriglobales bacterium]